MSKPLVFKADGSQVGLGERIGRGGEGEVYALANDHGHAVKIYLDALAGARREKISAIVAGKLSEKTPLAAFPIRIRRFYYAKS
jgi:DNA-binding helix-hairpin-helix protein with protein kinase domain